MHIVPPHGTPLSRCGSIQPDAARAGKLYHGARLTFNARAATIRGMDGYHFSTGLTGLDKVLKGILPGDNIVWQVDSLDDYRTLVTPCLAEALKSGRPVVYFRFADHPPLVTAVNGVAIHPFNPEDGFEAFVGGMHEAIHATGRGAHYVFDCLSELANHWHSDVMLGNFFRLTCPYLFDLETLAYFALLRNHHSAYALDPIMETTQLFLDVYNHRRLYIRPIKVQHRYSATMNMLHRRGEDGTFEPVSDSTVIAEILTSAKWSGLHADRNPGFWERAFLEAQELKPQAQAGLRPSGAEQEALAKLIPMIITRDEPMTALVRRYLTLDDVLEVRRRMIGSGLIGGKSVGMLLARAILRRSAPDIHTRLEAHDSFFVGSDVFYSFLVSNGIWWTRQKQRDPEAFYENATRARRLIITGSFPERTLRQFQEMIDYFGQSPFIVRSSSLLEDNYGNAFAGKYESVFCANQGPRSQRMEDFLAAVKSIYASAMSERALRYRARRGMLDRDEQMALLVMRVSGRTCGRKFYPPVAGVGLSFNPYVWHPEIDPAAGVIRLVFGLGTRAVERPDDDYTRLVALNAPDRRPEHSFDEVRRHTQRRVDFIDLEANHLTSGDFHDIAPDLDTVTLELVAPLAASAARHSRDMHRHGRAAAPDRVLTFDRLLSQTGFVADVRHMLATLEQAYSHPVDIEFTANVDEEAQLRINLVQCRPLQVRGTGSATLPEMNVPPEDCIITARSAVIGQSRVVNVDTFIYVVPSVYGTLPVRDRHEIARLLGDINQALKTATPDGVTVLLGPGRWGTASPELGVPVNFSDINGVSVIGEIVTMHSNLIPDVSLGTHFLSELVEMDMLYVALFPDQHENRLDETVFMASPSLLSTLVPDAAKKWTHAVRVIDAAVMAPPGKIVMLTASAPGQHVNCFFASR